MSSPLPPLPLLSACELTAIRTAAELALDTPVTVAHSAAIAAGAYGEQLPGTPAVVATCNARFTQPSAPILAQYAERIGHLQTWLVALPTSVLPHVEDTITITATNDAYTVQAVLQPQSFSSLNRVLVGKST